MINNNLFDKESVIFMGAKRNPDDCSIGIFGVNYDGTCSFKSGARFGPNAIRKVSRCLETFCPRLGKDLDEINYIDLGSIEIKKNNSESVIEAVKLATNYLIKKKLTPIMLGGEHSITRGAIEALVNKYPDLVLIQLDAHADLRESYMGNKNSHACTMQRCLDVLPKKKILQVGIRSGTKEEFKFMNQKNQLVNFIPGGNAQEFKKALLPYVNSPIYLTVDLDWFDPSLLPGTGTPEIGGPNAFEAQKVIRALLGLKLVGADLVEVSPPFDPSGGTAWLGASLMFELICILAYAINNKRKA